MGIVYAARHEVLGQRVALKVLRPDYALHDEVNARFLQEARTAARIESEHVARTLDVGKLPSGLPYIVIEHLEGKDLGEVLGERGPLAVSDAIDYVLQALEAVAEAHAIGLVHRDLKPSNLFLARRRDGSATVKVLDFGISKATVEDEVDAVRLTSTRQILGTPAYISPEQLRQSRDVDARADVWAVGVVLYELLSGDLPFNGAGVGSMFAAILEQTPRALRELRPDVPPELDAAVMKCLARSRGARWQSVADLAQALSPFGSRSAAVSSERILRVLPMIDVKVDDEPASVRAGGAASAPEPPAALAARAGDLPVDPKSTIRMPHDSTGTNPQAEMTRSASPIVSTAASWTASTPGARRRVPLLAAFVALGSVGLVLVLVSVAMRRDSVQPRSQGSDVTTPSAVTAEANPAPSGTAADPAPEASVAIRADRDASAAVAATSSAPVGSATPLAATAVTAATTHRYPIPRPSSSAAPAAHPSAAPAAHPSASSSPRPNVGILERN